MAPDDEASVAAALEDAALDNNKPAISRWPLRVAMSAGVTPL